MPLQSESVYYLCASGLLYCVTFRYIHRWQNTTRTHRNGHALPSVQSFLNNACCLCWRVEKKPRSHWHELTANHGGELCGFRRKARTCEATCVLESFREALVAALHLGLQVRLCSVSRKPRRVQQCEVPYTNVAFTPRFSRRASCSDTPPHARLLWPAGGVQARIESFNAGAAVRRNLQCAECLCG